MGANSVMLQQQQETHSAYNTYSKPRFNDFSYTAESSSCLYRIMSSSRPNSTLDNDGLLPEVSSTDTLLGDIICEESLMTEDEEEGDDLFKRAAIPAGLTRRRRGERSAKPDADGRVVVKMATTVKVNEVKR